MLTCIPFLFDSVCHSNHPSVKNFPHTFGVLFSFGFHICFICSVYIFNRYI